MTMKLAYEYEREAMPSPERLEKVEESMENLLDVLAERDRAVNVLEHGHNGEQGRRWVVDMFGRGRWRRNTEHVQPMHDNEHWTESDKPTQTPWAIPYKKLYREKLAAEKQRKEQLRQEEVDLKERLLPQTERVTN